MGSHTSPIYKVQVKSPALDPVTVCRGWDRCSSPFHRSWAGKYCGLYTGPLPQRAVTS